jgi:hypothetical protein
METAIIRATLLNRYINLLIQSNIPEKHQIYQQIFCTSAKPPETNMSLETENQDGTNEIHWHSRQFSA